MSLSLRLAEYVRAAFTGIWVQSHEHDDALAEIARLCHEQRWLLAVWDVERGLRVSGSGGDGQPPPGATADPLAAIRALPALATAVTPTGPDVGPEAQASGASAGQAASSLLVLVNYHRFLNGAEVVQAMAQQVQAGKAARTFVLILSPVVQVPVELEKHFVVLEHDLPDKAQLQEIAAGIATEAGEMPEGEALDRLLDAAAGLTRYEAEGAFSLSLVRHAALRPEAVWELKAGTLKKGGLLTLHRSGERFDDLGGLDALKGFCSKALVRRTGSVAEPRGILLLGVPGTGRSMFAKALGNETGRPTVVLDVGALLGGIVGETEGRTRAALAAIDAMAPCVCFLDEVEKALAGASGQHDSGVGARLFGTFLGWLSDHKSDVFVVCTSNDVSRLPPEFARSERFDAIWFLDLPGSAQKQRIWQQYLRTFRLARQPLPKDADWTGAEIRACCRLASLLDVPLLDAARYVVPVAVTAAESVAQLRAWAAGRCLDADAGGVYSRGAAEPKLPRRVSRPGSN